MVYWVEYEILEVWLHSHTTQMIRRKKLGARRGRIRDGLLFSNIQSRGGEGEGEDWMMDMEEDGHNGLEKNLE